MSEELNMLAEVEQEGQTLEEVLAEHEQVDTPAESQPEEDNKEEVVEEDDKSSKQSRNWKQIREELAEERTLRAEQDKILEEERKERISLKERLEAIEKGTETTEQPEFLKQMVGENPEVAKSFKTYEEQLLERAKTELRADMQAEAEAKQKKIDEANDFIETQLSKVEKEQGIELKPGSSERNELLKIVHEYAPTDANNNYDFSKGYKIMQALKGKEQEADNTKTEARKIIADATLSKNTGGKDTKTFVTSHDIRKAGGWRNFISK